MPSNICLPSAPRWFYWSSGDGPVWGWPSTWSSLQIRSWITCQSSQAAPQRGSQLWTFLSGTSSQWLWGPLYLHRQNLELMFETWLGCRWRSRCLQTRPMQSPKRFQLPKEEDTVRTPWRWNGYLPEAQRQSQLEATSSCRRRGPL